MNTTSSTVESAEVGLASNDPNAPKRSLGSRFKKIVTGGEDSIGKLRAMAARRDEIVRSLDLVLAECKKIEGEVVTAQREFDASPTPDGVHKLIAIRLRAREASEVFAAFDQRVRRGAANQEF